MTQNNQTIKKYLKNILDVYHNIPKYDDFFNRGKEACKTDASALNLNNVNNYGLCYITPFLLVSVYEFFSLFWKFKYETDKNQWINEKKFINLLLDNFNIDYTKEPEDIKNKIFGSEIFFKKVQAADGTNQTYREILRQARNTISHNNFYSKIKEFAIGFNLMDTIMHCLEQIIN